VYTVYNIEYMYMYTYIHMFWSKNNMSLEKIANVFGSDMGPFLDGENDGLTYGVECDDQNVNVAVPSGKCLIANWKITILNSYMNYFYYG